jgi:hypothetical protein
MSDLPSAQKNSAILLAGFLAFTSLSPASFAQDAVSSGLTWRVATGYAELTVADKYIYHGYVVEDHGPVVQPYLELFENFYYKNDGFLNSISFKFSLFSSIQFHDQRHSQDEKPLRWWYELQIEPGIEFILAKELTFTASYLRFESPNNAFRSSDAVELNLTMDDKRELGAFALYPHLSWIAPLSVGSQTNDDGNYFEIGIAPRRVFAKSSRYPFTLTVPATVGLGDKRYYVGDNFGFVSIGAKLAVPLTFVPGVGDKCEFSASATYYYLGDAPANLSNNGDRNQSVIAATVSAAF